MPVRLLRPYANQAVNTLYWGSADTEDMLRATGNADDRLDRATDYADGAQRIVTGAVATASRNATMYNMNSASAQTLTIPVSGFWPINTVLTVVQLGAGATTIVGGTGVTITAGNGLPSLVTKGQNYVAQLIKNGTNSWLAVGGLGG